MPSSNTSNKVFRRPFLNITLQRKIYLMENPNSGKFKNFILFLKGMGMGACDVVPGVSGGTIAFISGIYEVYGTTKQKHFFYEPVGV